MKLKYAFRFNIEHNPIINWLGVYNSIKTVLKVNPDEKMFTMIISVLREPKTYNQLAYLHAEILLKIIQGYREAGHDVPFNKEQSLIWVKKEIKTLPEIMFIEDVPNAKTGETYTALRTFSDASKEEMSDIIDKVIRIYGDYFKIEFETPEAYKRRKGFK